MTVAIGPGEDVDIIYTKNDPQLDLKPPRSDGKNTSALASG